MNDVEKPARRPIVIGAALTVAFSVVTGLAIAGVLLSRVHEISGNRGGTLQVLAVKPLGDLDPSRHSTAFDASLLHATVRTPYAFQPGRGIVSDLALGPPEISDDSTRLELTLRPDVSFGPPVDRKVTAEDFVYAIERGFLPSVDSPYAQYYLKKIRGLHAFREGKAKSISGLQAPDEDTLVIELADPVARTVAQAMTMPMTAPVPREYASRFDQKPSSTYARHQVATGPYRFEPEKNGLIPGPDAQSVSLVRNPSWDPDTDFRQAFLDRISVKPAPDTDAASESVLHGRASVSGDFAASPDVLHEALATTPDQVRLTHAGVIVFIILNTTAPPLDDVDVRRALTAAFDQKGAREALGGRVVGKIPTHWIPPGIPGYEEAGGAEGPGFDFLSHPDGDLELARSYMRAAGYPSGRYDGDESLVAIGTDDTFTHDIAGSVRDAFRSVGIPIEIRIVPPERAEALCSTAATTPDVCLNATWTKDFDDAVSILPPLFAGSNIRKLGNSNRSLLDDDTVNVPINQAATTTGAADRAEEWADADREVTSVAPGIPVVWDYYPLLHSEDVKGIVDEELGRWDLAFTSLR